MKRLFVISGLTCLLLQSLPALAQTPSPIANEKTLFQRLLRITEDELLLGNRKVEPAVNHFVRRVGPEGPGAIPENMLENFYREGVSGACGGTTFADLGKCQDATNTMNSIVQKQQRIRTLGRDLQLIASGYELALEEFPGKRPGILSPKTAALLRIWQAETDHIAMPFVETKVRSALYEDTEEVNELFLAIEAALTSLATPTLDKEAPERQHAAIWRYSYGFRNIAAESDECDVRDGSPTQHSTARSCVLETALQDVWDKVSTTTFKPALHGSEIAILPPHFIADPPVKVWVWVGPKVNGKITGDVGISWDLALDPVFPNLNDPDHDTCLEDVTACTGVSMNGAVPGGVYPSAPEPPPLNQGICSMPFNKQGYLCRPIPTDRCPLLPNSGAPEPSMQGIRLSECEPVPFKTPVRITESGPNICGIGGWRRSPEDLTNTVNWKDNPCSNCAVNMVCGDLVVPTKANARTSDITIPNTVMPGAYEAMYGMALAQQMCNQPAGPLHSSTNTCCPRQRQAWAVACHASAEDGNFDGTSVTIDQCASYLADTVCNGLGQGTCLEQSLTASQQTAMNQVLDNNVRNLAMECAAAVNEINPNAAVDADPRAEEMALSLPMVCTPECKAQFENTIGNNACYIGQCIEQSREFQRLVPGRMPEIANGEAFPWDACVPPYPDEETQLVLPPLPFTRFPEYRPQTLLKALDLAFCQVNALPLSTVPYRCAFNITRATQFAQHEAFLMVPSVADQQDEANDSIQEVGEISRSIGIRMGRQLFGKYFGDALTSMTTVTDALDVLMKSVADTTFPQYMCPRYAGEMNFCATYAPNEN